MKDLKGGEEALSLHDLPLETLFVFYYFIKCK